MIRLKLLVTVLACLPVMVFADEPCRTEGTVQSCEDYVMIRFMPSRTDFMRSEPVTELKSRSYTTFVIRDGTVMGTNEPTRQFFERATAIAEKGLTSNQQYFHVRFKIMEIRYKGETVALEYTDSTGEEKFKQYEADWQALYKDVYQFLLKDLEISQEKANN